MCLDRLNLGNLNLEYRIEEAKLNELGKDQTEIYKYDFWKNSEHNVKQIVELAKKSKKKAK